jgi:transketolase C-terminal domain/subunit
LAEDFPPVEDFTELLEAELLVEISPADSGATPEEDSSSPQAVKDIVMANSATKINIVPL